MAIRNRRDTQSENVRLAIEGDILSGRLEPGSQIDEDAIAQQFGVSRTPVREAILQLVNSGIVEKIPRKGAVVARMDIRRLIQMFESMSELEGCCARLAARRMTSEERSALKEAHVRSEAALALNDHEAYWNHSYHFHVLIINGSHNEVLIDLTNRLGVQIVPYRQFQFRYPGCSEANLRDHAAILEEILREDSEGAAQLFRSHTTLQGNAFAEYVSIAGGTPPLRSDPWRGRGMNGK